MTRTDALPVPGEGELAEGRMRRRAMTIKGTLFVIGLFAGGYVGYALAESDFDLGARWPTGISIALALVYVVSISAGSLLLHGKIDELERDRSYKAAAVAGSGYLLLYPVWFVLWKGGILVEPIHWLLFVGFWLLLLGAALYYRLR